jgi:integrase
VRITRADDIKKIIPPPKGNMRHPVAGCPGLNLKVTANNAWAWTFRYRPKLGPRAGASREYTIGDYPLFGLGLAKDEYKRLRRRAQQGEDPLQEIEEARAAPTMRELAKVYLEEHSSRFKSGHREKERFDMYILPRLGSIKVASVTYADCDALHRSMKAKPVQANRTLTTLKSAFKFAIKRGWRDDNPATLVERYSESPRERYLKDEEVPRLFKALNNCGSRAAADCIRLILLTGARRGEVQAMKWADVDLGSRTWFKPTTKTGKSHRVPLSPPAAEVIARQPQASDLVFPGRQGRMRDLKWHWAQIREEAGLGDLHLHDLRHSAASFLASDGESLRIIGELLGHRTPVTTQRYAHIHDRAARAAAERLGRRLTTASESTDDALALERAKK